MAWHTFEVPKLSDGVGVPGNARNAELGEGYDTRAAMHVATIVGFQTNTFEHTSIKYIYYVVCG